MSLYNMSWIEGPDPISMMQGFNDYADGFAFTVLSFCIFLALFFAIYARREDIASSLLVSGFAITIISTLLWFGGLVPIYIPFVFFSLVVVGLFMTMAGGE